MFPSPITGRHVPKDRPQLPPKLGPYFLERVAPTTPEAQPRAVGDTGGSCFSMSMKGHSQDVVSNDVNDYLMEITVNDITEEFSN